MCKDMQENSGRFWICLLLWIVITYQRYFHMLKFIKLFTVNMYSFLYVDYTPKIWYFIWLWFWKLVDFFFFFLFQFLCVAPAYFGKVQRYHYFNKFPSVISLNSCVSCVLFSIQKYMYNDFLYLSCIIFL